MTANALQPQNVDHLRAALSSSCAALLALEDASGELADIGPGSIHPRDNERRAIELVREAIQEIKGLVGDSATTPLAFGFVCADDAV